MLETSILKNRLMAIGVLDKDDYNYSHYMIIKLCIEKVEKVIAEHPDVIAVAWAND